MTSYINRTVWKTIDQGETMKVFCDSNKYFCQLSVAPNNCGDLDSELNDKHDQQTMTMEPSF